MSLTSWLFLFCFIGGITACIFRSPMYGLYTYIAVFYLDAPSRWWGADLPGWRWSLVVAIVTFGTAMMRQSNRDLWRRQPIIWVFITYTLWMWVQTLWAFSPEDHSEATVLFSKLCIVLIMVFTIVDSREKLIGFFVANSLGCLYLGYLAYSTYLGGRLDGIGGPGIDDSNTLGMHMSAVIFLAAAVYLCNERLYIRLAAAASIPFALNTVIMSGSRGAFLALVCGGLAFLYLRPRQQTKRAFVYATLGLTAFLVVAGGNFWSRMGTIVDAVQQSEEMDTSAESRYVVFEAQFKIASQYPFGGGHKTTTYFSPQYIPVEFQAFTGGRSSHNTFMSTLVDQGIPGLLLWVAIFALIMRMNRKVRTLTETSRDVNLAWLNAAIGAAVIVVIVGGMFAPFLRAEIYVWLIAGQCTVLYLAERHSVPIRRTNDTNISERMATPSNGRSRLGTTPTSHQRPA